MAVFFPGGQSFGWLAFNTDMTVAAPAPTEQYIYPHKMGSVAHSGYGLWGRKADDGTFIDGPIVDVLQATTTDPDWSGGVLEVDDDTDSPYRNEMRFMCTMS